VNDIRVLLLNGPLTDERVARIRSRAPEAVVETADDAGDIDERIAVADVIAGSVDAKILARADRLRWVHTWAAGPDSSLFPEMLASPVVLTSSKGNGAVPLAEQAMLLMLLLNRSATTWLDAQKDHRWERFTHPELAGQTCGILGLGYSGSDLALKAQAFHMRVVGLRRGTEPVPGVDRLYRPEELHDFLAESDVLVVTAPLTSETRGMLGEPEFRAMKSSAHYICFSRGGIADDAVLLRALQEGWIAGAGLDAHGVEPLPADSPFWTAPNTIITPHNGATTPQTSERGIDIFADNLRRFVDGAALVNVVDKAAGY
jgi:phosphoglycerate dehydrogenase-like enzyme